MMSIIQRITAKNINTVDEYGDITNILVRIEKDQWEGKVGDIGIIVWEGIRGHLCNRRWTIRFATGNTGKDYPSLRYMLERETEQGNFSFYIIQIK